MGGCASAPEEEYEEQRSDHDNSSAKDSKMASQKGSFQISQPTPDAGDKRESLPNWGLAHLPEDSPLDDNSTSNSGPNSSPVHNRHRSTGSVGSGGSGGSGGRNNRFDFRPERSPDRKGDLGLPSEEGTRLLEKLSSSGMLRSSSDLIKTEEVPEPVQPSSLTSCSAEELLQAAQTGDSGRLSELLVQAPHGSRELMLRLNTAQNRVHAFLLSSVTRSPIQRQAAPHAVNCVFEDNKRLIHVAAEEGHVEVLKKLLEANSHPLAVDADGQTALHVAAANSKLQAAKALLSRGGEMKELTMTDEYKMTPLHLACENGDEGMVEALLDAMHTQRWLHTSTISALKRGSAHFLALRGNHTGVVAILESVFARSSRGNSRSNSRSASQP
eukprot:6173966-Pleurochrysis_carterae.AAC.1